MFCKNKFYSLFNKNIIFSPEEIYFLQSTESYKYGWQMFPFLISTVIKTVYHNYTNLLHKICNSFCKKYFISSCHKIGYNDAVILLPWPYPNSMGGMLKSYEHMWNISKKVLGQLSPERNYRNKLILCVHLLEHTAIVWGFCFVLFILFVCFFLFFFFVCFFFFFFWGGGLLIIITN